MTIKVRNIFATVSDKSVLDPLLDFWKSRQKARPLPGRNPKLRPGLSEVKFWGTEGTAAYLKSKGFDAQSVVSGFDFDGRVKSLDKVIFARILADRTNKKHLEELQKLTLSRHPRSNRGSDPRLRKDDKALSTVIASEAKQSNKKIASPSVRDDGGGVWAPFDAVIVDLYPLDKNNFPESMDIGGQALIRAAIKNYKNVAVAFDASSLASLVNELVGNAGSTTLNFRKTQAQKAAKFVAERAVLEASVFE